LKAAIFGHAADMHLHVNILPENYDQYIKGMALAEKWADRVRAENGGVVTEHGVGKIKKRFFKPSELPQRMAAILELKQKFDPLGLWNPGNMIE